VLPGAWVDDRRIFDPVRVTGPSTISLKMVADEHNPPARVVAAVKPEPDQAERRVQPRWLPNVRRRRSSTARTSSSLGSSALSSSAPAWRARGLDAQPQPSSPSADDRGAASARDTPWPRASTAPRSAGRAASDRRAPRHVPTV